MDVRLRCLNWLPTNGRDEVAARRYCRPNCAPQPPVLHASLSYIDRVSVPVAEVTRHGRAVTSAFGLLGTRENDLTAALGFTLSRSPSLRSALIRHLTPDWDAAGARVRMEVRDASGRTDLEVECAAGLLVIEAKRGWLLPSSEQLEAYAPRVLRSAGGALVTLSSASPEWAAARLPPAAGGVPVRHLPWPEVLGLLGPARAAARGRERLWLDELSTYLEGALRMRDVADGWTYCVSISTRRLSSAPGPTFRDWVDQGVYFHPYGKRWPRRPPNFLAFRWGNRVQRVHRVVQAEVVPSLAAALPGVPATPDTTRPHALYRLGPALPGTPVPSGRSYRAARCWVLLDQLLTSESLAAALAATAALTGRSPTSSAEDEEQE